MELDYIDGQTPIDEEEKEGLKIRSISTRQELDEHEQKNIEDAIFWSISRNFKPEQVFTEKFIKTVHRKMFGTVWSWAGSFRKTEKNIGIESWKIPTALKILLDDALFWYAHQTYQPDELAIRFKHRLVSIHCFPNGNGRHSRLMADIIVEHLYHQPVFSWGSGPLGNKGPDRHSYLKALKTADQHDYTDLIAFARS